MAATSKPIVKELFVSSQMEVIRGDIISEDVDGDDQITGDDKVRIHKSSVPELVGMQTDYNLQVAKKDNKLNKRLEEIRKIASMF